MVLQTAKATCLYEDVVREASFGKLSESISSKLYMYLKFKFRKELYSHQAAAINAALQGKHVGICTSTASGKSMCFSIPVFNEILTNPTSRAIYVFPIKALANDQLLKLQALARDLQLGDIVRKFDGDVNREERKKAIAEGRILVCTPDVLHTTLLRRHREEGYSALFQELKYVILDESHIYSGIFGSNMAFVVRRLRQICQNAGSNPQFISASATIGEPMQHFKNLTGIDDFEVIDHDGSPSYGRQYYFVSFDGSTQLSEQLVKSFVSFAEAGKRFIAFSESRQEVEHLIIDLANREPGLAKKVKPYRAGYDPAQRQKIENDLRSGNLVGVIATSALELGIDISELEVCLLIGVPDTKSSFFQRVGRVGRSKPGEVYLFKTNRALDDYYFSHPDEFIARTPEPLVINLENRRLQLDHYSCTRHEAENFENPLLSADIFPLSFRQLGEKMRDYEFPDEILYSSSPHFDVTIRSIADPIYTIIQGHNNDGIELGTINYSQLLREAYKGAVYLHMGRRYRVQKVSYSNRNVYVSPKCPFAFTRPNVELSVRERLTTGLRHKTWGAVSLSEISLGVYESVKGYVESRPKEEKEHVEFPKPMMRYFVTRGVLLHLRMPGMIDYGKVQGLATALMNSFPLVYPCAGGDIRVWHWTKGADEAKVYLFDNIAGGLDITSKAIDLIEALLVRIKRKIEGCACGKDDIQGEGCIMCVLPLHWQSYVANADKAGTLALLNAIIGVTSGSAFVAGGGQQVLSVKSNKRYGQLMLSAGSMVFTGRCEEGTIVSSKAISVGDINDRSYEIKVGNVVRTYLGRSLTLIQGDKEYWCASCGQESIELSEEVCPICSVTL